MPSASAPGPNEEPRPVSPTPHSSPSWPRSEPSLRWTTCIAPSYNYVKLTNRRFRYRVAYTLDASDGKEGDAKQYSEHYRTVLACRDNAEVARKAGLSCRVSVWTTLLSLMPPGSLSCSVGRTSMRH